MWKLIVEHDLTDFQGGALDILLGMTLFETSTEGSTRSSVYLYPDRASALEARKRLKARYRAKVHCETVPV